jgi:hypothetical protein
VDRRLRRLRWRLRNLLAMEPGFGPLDQRLLLTGAVPAPILEIDFVLGVDQSTISRLVSRAAA